MKMRLFIVLLALPLLAQAESLRSLVKTGNDAYKAGEFDEALNAYRQAQLEAPRNALGKFNEGAALYRQDEHDAAAEAFRAAALDAKSAGDSRLEAKSLFNLGNALLKGAETSEKYEPQASVDKLKQGAAAYRQALGRDPQLTAAAENLQIARARLSELLKQQAQQSQQPSQGSGDLESQIEEQLKKQQELSEDNRESQQNPSEGEQQQQAQRQKDLQQRSEELSQQTPDNQQAQEQLKQAAAEQQKAAQQLSQGQQQEAGESQQKAEGHLAQALQELQQQGEQESEQQQAQSQPPPAQGQEQGDAQPLQALELTPEDILDQERVARQRRQLMQGQQQRPVEKDW
jgi:hypothetical protein